MRVIILAGGLGTRLQAVTQDRPKPMVEIQGKPFLEYQINQLHAQGFREFVLCVGHLAHHILDYFGDGWRFGVNIFYAIETDLLGTAGAISNAQDFIDDTFLVVNGDSYLELDHQALMDFHRRQKLLDQRTIGTIVAAAVDNVSAYGALEVDAQGRILNFLEKAETSAGLINGGVYVLDPCILEFISTGQTVSVEKDTFPSVLERGYHLFSYPADGFFVDIGTPKGFRRFCEYIERKGKR